MLFAHVAADLKTQTLERQLAALCNTSAQIIALLGHFLAAEDEMEEEAQPGMSVLDGGTRACIENSLIKTLNRMDDILDDEDRWKPYKSIEALGEKEAVTKLRTVEIAEKLAQDQLRPSTKIATTLVQTQDGQWLTVIQGSPEPGMLYGIGNTPAQSLEDFDSKFTKELNDPVPPQTPEQPAQPKAEEAKPKRRKHSRSSRK